MRRLLSGLTISCASVALILLAAPAPAPAADAGGAKATNATIDGAGKSAESPTADSGNGAAGEGSEPSATTGAAAVTGPDEPDTHLTPPMPPLQLTDAQRQQIREAVADQDTEVTFQLKNTKPFKDFKASVGETIPPHLPAHALPSELTQKLPTLAYYQYVKVDKQVLIVNPMTKKIVDMFPETQG